jgi:hypothetical protein
MIGVAANIWAGHDVWLVSDILYLLICVGSVTDVDEEDRNDGSIVRPSSLSRARKHCKVYYSTVLPDMRV